MVISLLLLFFPLPNSYGFGPLALPKSISSVIWPFLFRVFLDFFFSHHHCQSRSEEKKRGLSFFFFISLLQKKQLSHLVYCPPALSSAGHGLYALIGHHPNPGRAPIPPPIRPSPPQPRGAAERATPQRAQVLAVEEGGGGEEEEVEGSWFSFFFCCCCCCCFCC